MHRSFPASTAKSCRDSLPLLQIAVSVAEGGRLPIPPRVELPGADTPTFAGLDRYISLMQRCWAQDPAERPTFNQVALELEELEDSMG